MGSGADHPVPGRRRRAVSTGVVGSETLLYTRVTIPEPSVPTWGSETRLSRVTVDGVPHAPPRGRCTAWMRNGWSPRPVVDLHTTSTAPVGAAATSYWETRPPCPAT